ncbi:MAG TPA: tetratricopeptide repeat protein [Anaerolineales bacterium]|nr:tetratricopeptide repeat protein [Anaerolineales bacterium]
MAYPSGTVTFLFTDIEGSTKLAQSLGDNWESFRARHHEILKSAIESNNGYVFQIIGDAFCASFHTAGDAVRAAAQAQIDFHNEEWGDTPIKIRMGINTGTAQASVDTDHSGGYKGYTVMARVQRIMSAGHGGQVLISLATEELVRHDLPENISLLDMEERRLKDLIHPEHIHQLVIQGLPSEFPPLKTLDAYRHNLPVQLTSFIGREKEIAEISKRIRTNRLVTLAGIGGTGKTRLALQVAADMIEEFPDGVWFVELASITEPDMIPQAILAAMGIPEQSKASNIQFLIEYLQKRKLLLILDNCEHLIDSCAKLAQKLVRDAAHIRIVSTSREALSIQGELIWQVLSLSLPDQKQTSVPEEFERYEAVQLFVERAALVQPQFQLTKDNGSDVARICSRLDGIPLAIELAAARARSMGVDEIAKRIEDRFRLLMGGNRTGLERHQTLRATISWSYNLLSDEEKHLFYRLSVFSGGWTLEAAEQVCSQDGDDFDILDTLTRLVEKSLVNLDGSRYHMLDTTRQFALEKLLETDDGSAMHDKHAAYYLELAKRTNKHEELIQNMERIEKEADNFRAAIEWQNAVQNTEAALHLLDTLGSIDLRFLWRGFPDEMETWFNKVRTLPNINDHPASYAGILNFMGRQFRSSMNISKNIAYLEEARGIWSKLGKEGELGLAGALQTLVEITIYNEDEISIPQSLLERSYELYQKHDNKRGIAWSTHHFGSLAMVQGHFDEAEKQYTKSIAKFQEIGDKYGKAYALASLGEMMREVGDYDRASEYWEQNLDIFREIINRPGTIYPLSAMGWVSLRKGEHGKAKKLFMEALDLSNEYGNNPLVIYCISGLAGVLGATGKHEQAAKLFSAVESLGEKKGRLEPADQKDYDHYLKVAREQLDESEFEKAWNTGRTMTIEQAIEYVLENLDE